MIVTTFVCVALNTDKNRTAFGEFFNRGLCLMLYAHTPFQDSNSKVHEFCFYTLPDATSPSIGLSGKSNPGCGRVTVNHRNHLPAGGRSILHF